MRYFLAPLAGFTDAPFRRLCFEGGADLCYGEMVSAAGLVHGSSPTRHLLETMPGEGPMAVQLFGATESDLAGASRIVGECVRRDGDGRAVELNLNAGCPMAKVVRTGAGARLVEDPGKIYGLLSAMAENTDLPITLKTRLGPHPGDTRIFEILDAAEHAGAKGIVVHARYTSQMHGGPVRLDVLADVVSRARIPVVGNGSVVDAKSAAAMAATGVAAIMVGRAALSRPDIFARLKGEGASGPGEDPAVRAERHIAYLLEFRELLARRYPGDHVPSEDGFVSVKMHTHLFRYFSGRPGAAQLRARLNAVRTLADVRAAIRI
jgi:tRNA-dihydrouridine synthase B